MVVAVAAFVRVIFLSSKKSHTRRHWSGNTTHNSQSILQSYFDHRVTGDEDDDDEKEILERQIVPRDVLNTTTTHPNLREEKIPFKFGARSLPCS